MKLKALMVVLVLAVISFMTGIVYAADGDLIVNGKLGVGTTPTEKTEINGNLKVSGNLAVSGTVTAPSVLTKYYESQELTMASGGGVSLAHGLGAEPKLVQCLLVCKTAHMNYSVGDKLIYPAGGFHYFTGTPFHYGVSVVTDSTNINIRFARTSIGVFVLDKNTGVLNNSSYEYWKLIVRAWSF